MTISFFVPGVPKPGGSKTAFLHPHTKKLIVMDDCKTSKEWKKLVKEVARQHIKEPMLGPITTVVYFQMPRPKSHYRANGELRPQAPKHPITRPDATKLWRSTEDALTGIAWKDDGQVVSQLVLKRYGVPGAKIFISEGVTE